MVTSQGNLKHWHAGMTPGGVSAPASGRLDSMSIAMIQNSLERGCDPASGQGRLTPCEVASWANGDIPRDKSHGENRLEPYKTLKEPKEKGIRPLKPATTD